jgi:hypothetical protein
MGWRGWWVFKNKTQTKNDLTKIIKASFINPIGYRAAMARLQHQFSTEFPPMRPYFSIAAHILP